ncbi:MAG: ATP-dependent protease ATPase subunit HslU [Planctomycetia bacterium]|nr:ATP-dependent protease ATPase subunit HslU [Planctomycetia bacterium]
MTPRQIVAELDKYIIGQHEAKRSVAIAIRNRWRRQQVEASMKKEIGPKNMMMIGPTGVGKTEIARRLAALTGAPFIKVEATKYTEVGYYGRDVESMVRELVENAVGIVRTQERQKIQEQAQMATENRLVDLIAQAIRQKAKRDETQASNAAEKNETSAAPEKSGGNSSFPFSLDSIRAIKIDTSAPLAGIAEFVKQLEKTLQSGSSSVSNEKQSSNQFESNELSGNQASNQNSNESGVLNDLVDSDSMLTDSSDLSNKESLKQNDESKESAKASQSVSQEFQVDLEEVRSQLRNGFWENEIVSIVLEQKSSPVIMGGIGMESMENDLQNMFENILPKKKTKRELTVGEARKIIFEQESENLINKEKVNAQAVELAENLGIIFIDEIDKIVASSQQHGADVSRQGVQRDLLPIVEGTTIQTKYGFVSTDHILFIAAGAFHRSKPNELMPELQGRFPIRVELSDLNQNDFIQILTEPHGALTKQYVALMKTEGVDLVFEDDAISAIAKYAYEVNQTSQNIGARRLYTIMERLLEELSFEAADMKMGRVVVNASYVADRLEEISQDEELNKFIL